MLVVLVLRWRDKNLPSLVFVHSGIPTIAFRSERDLLLRAAGPLPCLMLLLFRPREKAFAVCKSVFRGVRGLDLGRDEDLEELLVQDPWRAVRVSAVKLMPRALAALSEMISILPKAELDRSRSGWFVATESSEKWAWNGVKEGWSAPSDPSGFPTASLESRGTKAGSSSKEEWWVIEESSTILVSGGISLGGMSSRSPSIAFSYGERRLVRVNDNLLRSSAKASCRLAAEGVKGTSEEMEEGLDSVSSSPSSSSSIFSISCSCQAILSKRLKHSLEHEELLPLVPMVVCVYHETVSTASSRSDISS